MPSLHGNLAALDRRLRNITDLQTEEDSLLDVKDLDPDSTRTDYTCAQCAWTTPTSANVLARHFKSRHAFLLGFPDSKSRHEDQEQLKESKEHQAQKHGYLCPSCQRVFATANECEHHGPCESQRRITPNTKDDISSHTTVDQTVDDETPAMVESTLSRKGSLQSGSCPLPGCQLTFLNSDALYKHYITSHPLCIVYPGQPKPYKCPFCQKRYQHERFIPAHVRTHKPKFLGVKDAEVQEALIRQSQVALENRETQMLVEHQTPVGRTSGGEEEEESMPIKREEDYSLILKDSVVYFDDQGKFGVTILQDLDPMGKQESQLHKKMTPIGLVLQARNSTSSNFRLANEGSVDRVTPETPPVKPELSDPMDLDVDYPERFALDEDELPSAAASLYSSNMAKQNFDGKSHQSLIRATILVLRMYRFVTVGEVTDIFAYLLSTSQQIYVLRQLGSIDINQQDSNIVNVLRATVFKDLLDAWVDFKRFAIRFVPQLVVQANNMGLSSTKSITWALLQYCLNLENMIYRQEINIAHHFLRDPPLDHFVVTPNAPFPRIVAALAERVKNRTVHDSSIPFTNEMILKGVIDYVKILQMIFRPLYPIGAGYESLWKELRLL